MLGCIIDYISLCFPNFSTRVFSFFSSFSIRSASQFSIASVLHQFFYKTFFLSSIVPQTPRECFYSPCNLQGFFPILKFHRIYKVVGFYNYQSHKVTLPIRHKIYKSGVSFFFSSVFTSLNCHWLMYAVSCSDLLVATVFGAEILLYSLESQFYSYTSRQ